MSLTNCRFYEDKYPEVDSFVMVNVKQIAEMGAYVKLLEYDNIDGMILLSELSRRRIRSIQKLIRIGRNEVVIVLRVDKEKGYIDLSKRRVSPEDVIKGDSDPLETLYENIGWPLNQKYGHAHDAFKISITNPSVWDEITFPSEPVKNELQQYINSKLTPHPTKVRADIEVTCFGYDGIDAVKDALRAAEADNTPENQIKCLDKTLGVKLLEEAIVKIEERIKAAGGSCTVKMAPKAVTEHDDAILQELMEKRERENTQVSGDEDSESDDE
ncbi:Translation initiation factor 2 alpha subunit [Penicillium chrysogenum]|uniref:Translation initiation factor 2 alpha subunit n=1 Tax=Penicillium chrysogenum TaxID=5076 RepID=A0ABQ8X0C5_PENCH|nr:Translation initiation factor 2 alpha subunit [Penicillium chrysogenum]